MARIATARDWPDVGILGRLSARLVVLIWKAWLLRFGAGSEFVQTFLKFGYCRTYQ